MKHWMRFGLMLGMTFSFITGAALADPDTGIQRYQRLLRDRRYDVGPIDGVLGKKTRQALKRFQRAQNLAATGRLDRETTAALETSIPSAALQKTEPPRERSSLSAPISTDSPKPVMVMATIQYRPPRRGAPEARIAAASRATGETLSLAVLVPSDHTGLTVQAQPILYWYISAPTQHRVDFTITDEQSVQPLLDVTLRSPGQAGIQAIRLSDYQVQLQPGVVYKWAVAVSPDPEHRSRDTVASGGIQRVEPEATLRNKLAQADRGELPAIYADAGLWYDALGAISHLAESAPEEPVFRSQQTNLLKQVGLSDIVSASP